MSKKGEIVFTKYGPYSVVDTHIEDSSGEKLDTPRVISLCRCGESSNKPYCDGTHGEIGFVGEREKEDKNGTNNYVGEKITIHDNRYICCHHGTCNLENVFESEKRPWIDPDGSDNVDEIIRVVKECPSGALAYTRDGEKVDSWNTEQKVIVTKDGPLHVQGGVELKDDQQSERVLVSKEHYTLCRCGKSKKKPFCDGSHIDIGFKD